MVIFNKLFLFIKRIRHIYNSARMVAVNKIISVMNHHFCQNGGNISKFKTNLSDSISSSFIAIASKVYLPELSCWYLKEISEMSDVVSTQSSSTLISLYFKLKLFLDLILGKISILNSRLFLL